MFDLKRTLASKAIDEALNRLRTDKDTLVTQAVNAALSKANESVLSLVKGEGDPEVSKNYKLLLTGLVQGLVSDVLKDPQKVKEFLLSQL